MQRFIDDTDYLVIPSHDYDRIPGSINGKFFRAATVTGERGEPLLFVYSKTRVGDLSVLNTADAYRQFDEEFGNLKSLPSELRSSRSRQNPYAQYYWEDLEKLLESLR